MTHFQLELFKALLFCIMAAYLWRLSRENYVRGERSWRYFFVGFALILVGFLVGITKDIPYLNKFIVLGNTPYAAILKNGILHPVGFIAVAFGIGKLLPFVDKLRKTETELKHAVSALENKVDERLADLAQINKQLSKEIGERRKTEVELRQSEQRLELALKGADLGLWDYNIQTGEAFINERRAEMVGYRLEESEPNIAWSGSQINPEDREGIRKAFNAYVAGRTPLFESEHRLRHKSGEYIWVLARGKIMEWNESGHPVRIVGTSLDITDRKNAEAEVQSARNELERRVEERTAELKKSEEKYKFLVEESFVGVFLQKETRIVFTNSRLREMLGYEEGELEEQYHWRVYRPEYQEIAQERVRALLRGEPATPRYEVCMQRKDGSSFEAEIEERVVEFDGEPGIQVWISDISDRKRAENALRESEEIFRTAFQTFPEPVAITRLSDGVFIEANDGFTEISGFTREEVIGKSAQELDLWYDQGDRDLLIAGLKERGYVTNLETQFRGKDGQVRSGLMSARTIFLAGEPHILTASRDLENWKQAERALRESEEKYRTLFEDSRDAVYITTRAGILVDANQAFLDLLGFSREEARNMEILQIYADAAALKRFQSEIERKGSLKDYEVSFRKKDGTKIEGLLTSTVRRDRDGTVLGYHGIVRDVTEHNNLQKQLLQSQKMESIGTLAGGIAHDFNNLLQVIIGYSDMLLFNKKQTDPDYDRLKAVRQAGRDGSELAKRILAFSRRLEPNSRPIDLNNEIVRVQKMVERTVSKMIRIEILLAENLQTVNADPSQMEQMLMNLVVNAQHAMPDGGRITIETANVTLDEDYSRTHLDVEPGRYVLLSVSDTGHGMDKEVLEHMFEPFYTTKEAGEGTGLGLAMVFGIIKSHKGHIFCYSEPGTGTTFKIYLPAISGETDRDVPVAQQMPAFGTETILLVDDEKSVRKVGEQMLRTAGYTVLTAANGRGALEIYRSNPKKIDLVLLDLMMPEMGGKRCLEELLKINPHAKVIIASGYSANGPTKDALTSGAKGFVDKPYDMQQVLEAVREVLDAE